MSGLTKLGMLGNFFLTMPNHWCGQAVISPPSWWDGNSPLHAPTSWLISNHHWAGILVLLQSRLQSHSSHSLVSRRKAYCGKRLHSRTQFKQRQHYCTGCTILIHMYVPVTTVQLCSTNMHVFTGAMPPGTIIAVLQCGTKCETMWAGMAIFTRDMLCYLDQNRTSVHNFLTIISYSQCSHI